MTRDHASVLLVGRDADSSRFTDDVLSHRLVILMGDSGVGKSSLLNVGLIRALRHDGFEPLVCNDWSGGAKRIEDPEAFVAAKVRGQLPPVIDLDAPGAGGLCDQLDAEFRDTAVLVLDQFEELIRYQPELFHRMLDWIVRIGRNHFTRVVLSLRSEYAHRLRALDSAMGPFTMARYVLEPLQSPEVIRQVICSANDPGHQAISDEATAELVTAWAAALRGRGRSDLGLLHVQAALYALYARAGGTTVEQDNVLAMSEASGGRLFALGITEAVALKLDRCVSACSAAELDAPLDSVLVTGTSAIIRRAVGQLSSGGYKLVREEWDLAEKTLKRELDIINPDRKEAERLFRTLSGLANVEAGSADLLSATRAAIETDLGDFVPPGGTRPDYLAHLGVNPAPWITDPEDVSSGPMLGMAPRSILVEEMRRFVFGVEWLREACLVRATSPAAGQTMLALIHDGFGLALEEWAGQRQMGPAEALTLLTAAQGESYIWQSDRSDNPQWTEFDGGTGYLTITNVRWRYCRVSAAFRRVVFVNCDFRGSRFDGCGFRGVVFVNCLLDGVAFSGCTIYGPVAPPTVGLSAGERTQLPSFSVPASELAVRTLNRYRETAVEGDALFSITSGVPAVPWAGSHADAVSWEPQAGGLTMYGGRLSSLMVRNCVFEADGTLALRHIAGSSLDLVEQSTGRVELYVGAIRGLSITRAVHQDENAERGITLNVRASVLANTWFGDGLSGMARIEDSVLWQLVNASDRKDFEVHVRNCGYYGLVNVSTPHESNEQSTFQIDAITDREELVASAMRMDYRSVPARLELERRANRSR